MDGDTIAKHRDGSADPMTRHGFTQKSIRYQLISTFDPQSVYATRLA
jgi:hypothetical protein